MVQGRGSIVNWGIGAPVHLPLYNLAGLDNYL
jgi:hypothetical protein